MDIKLAKTRLKQYRKQQLWSQEELSAASGLGLRTIQRAEGEGVASAETLKALAATLQVDREALLETSPVALPYFNIQFGYVTVGSMLVVVTMAILAFIAGTIPPIPLLAICSICALVAILFAMLSTRVDSDKVSWYFGIGLIAKSVALSEIDAHRKVRNKAWWGWGLRLIPGGWMYNVSGFHAVELRLKNGRIARVGTDEPEAFNSAIERALTEVGE